tara:strand:- start:1801 stop:2355 length:555 start_codon:yes stop_codon:yes gene_type:complete
MKIKSQYYFLPLFIGFFSIELNALPEMIIGESSIKPGIDLIFEGGIKDDVQGDKFFLNENETDIHLEVIANWSDNAPSGSPVGGHVAYLDVTAVIANEKTNKTLTVNLMPHLNMSDNLHYAQNIKLPGAVDQNYTVIFKVNPPKLGNIGMHYDWRQQVSNSLTPGGIFEFNHLNFKEIALSTRR